MGVSYPMQEYQDMRTGPAGYELVGEWLLRAQQVPVAYADYRQAVGSLWAALWKNAKLPGGKSFDHGLTVARQKLDAAYVSAVSLTDRRALERATAALNRAEEEAADAGLL